MEILPGFNIDDGELEEHYIRAGGPGGQNVNKLATAVQLRFDVLHSPSLPAEVRERLMRLAAGQVTLDGVLVINSRRFRTQARNRQEARDRLAGLLARAAIRPRQRRQTHPTRAARRRRLESKRLDSRTKASRAGTLRRTVSDWEG